MAKMIVFVCLWG